MEGLNFVYGKISAVMCTYGRFTCVQNAINMFLAQDYVGHTELIVYNTDVESPYRAFFSERITTGNTEMYFINNNIDKVTKLPYTNVGAIRRDALEHATGDYVITWDDDDIFMPWFMRQSINRIVSTNRPFFKPKYSFWNGSNSISLVKNTMEASILSDIKKVREYGYDLHSGKEGLAWYTKARDNRELVEDDNYCIPQYCFNWGDGQINNAPHKQSGDINNPNNFDNHKAASIDRVLGKSIQIFGKEKMLEIYSPYFNYIKQNHLDFDIYLLNKYFTDAATYFEFQ
jgi:glycosyltransferase involved in cell wall biosynthesis